MIRSVFVLLLVYSTVLASGKVYFEAKLTGAEGTIGEVSEGHDFGYFLLAKGALGPDYDFEDGIASRIQGSEREFVGVLSPYFASGTNVQPVRLELTDRVIRNLNFWACKNTDDPHKYSKDYYLITASDIDNSTVPFKDCLPAQVLIHQR